MTTQFFEVDKSVAISRVGEPIRDVSDDVNRVTVTLMGVGVGDDSAVVDLNGLHDVTLGDGVFVTLFGQILRLFPIKSDSYAPQEETTHIAAARRFDQLAAVRALMRLLNTMDFSASPTPEVTPDLPAGFEVYARWQRILNQPFGTWILAKIAGARAPSWAQLTRILGDYSLRVHNGAVAGYPQFTVGEETLTLMPAWIPTTTVARTIERGAARRGLSERRGDFVRLRALDAQIQFSVEQPLQARAEISVDETALADGVPRYETDTAPILDSSLIPDVVVHSGGNVQPSTDIGSFQTVQEGVVELEATRLRWMLSSTLATLRLPTTDFAVRPGDLILTPGVSATRSTALFHNDRWEVSEAVYEVSTSNVSATLEIRPIPAFTLAQLYEHSPAPYNRAEPPSAFTAPGAPTIRFAQQEDDAGNLQPVIEGGYFAFLIEPSDIGQPVFEYRVRIWNDSEPLSDSDDDVARANDYKQDLDYRLTGTSRLVAFDLAYADKSYHIQAFAINDYGESPASNRLDVAVASGVSVPEAGLESFRIAPPVLATAGFFAIPKREASLADLLHYTRRRAVLAAAGALAFGAVAAARATLAASPLVQTIRSARSAVLLGRGAVNVIEQARLSANLLRNLIRFAGLRNALIQIGVPVTPPQIAVFAVITAAHLLITEAFVRAITPSNDGIFITFTVNGNGYRLPDENADMRRVEIQVRHDGISGGDPDRWTWGSLDGFRQGLINPFQNATGLTTGATNETITERTYTLFDPIEARPSTTVADVKPEFRMGKTDLDEQVRLADHRIVQYRIRIASYDSNDALAYTWESSRPGNAPDDRGWIYSPVYRERDFIRLWVDADENRLWNPVVTPDDEWTDGQGMPPDQPV